MTVKLCPNDKGNPPGKLADAELHFDDGDLAGLKLVGFAVWERRSGGGRNVTFPARQYQRERRAAQLRAAPADRSAGATGPHPRCDSRRLPGARDGRGVGVGPPRGGGSHRWVRLRTFSDCWSCQRARSEQESAMSKKERRKKPAKADQPSGGAPPKLLTQHVAPVVTTELDATELMTLAKSVLRAGYMTNGTPATLAKMAAALSTQLALPVADPEAVALFVVQAAYPTTVANPTKLRAMAALLRPYLDAPVVGEPDEIHQDGRR